MPEIILVRKIYPRNPKKGRKWRLKQLTIEREERYAQKLKKSEIMKEDRDRERFLQVRTRAHGLEYQSFFFLWLRTLPR